MDEEIADDLIAIRILATSLSLRIPSKSRSKVLWIRTLIDDIHTDFDESATKAPRTVPTLSELLAAQNGMLSYGPTT